MILSTRADRREHHTELLKASKSVEGGPPKLNREAAPSLQEKPDAATLLVSTPGSQRRLVVFVFRLRCFATESSLTSRPSEVI